MKNNLDELWRDMYGEKAAYEFASSTTIRKMVNKKLGETRGDRLGKCQKGVAISGMVMACTAVLLFVCIYHATNSDRRVKTADPVSEETMMVSEEKYASGGKKDFVESKSVSSGNEDYLKDLRDLRDIAIKDGFYYAVATKGEPILTVCDGIVISSGWETGYGYCVAIQDGDNRIWKYGHCSELRAAEGEHVRLGDVIAYVGSTGVTEEDAIMIKVLDLSRSVLGEIVTRKHPVTKEIAGYVSNQLVTRVVITNGSTGEKREIADSEKVIQILEQMKELELKYEGRNNASGYQYLITLWNEEKLIRGISIQGNDYVVVESERYEASSLEGLLEVICD
ncbi:MAG: M23 family metallopeptidase [Acetatifactor sp.]|nr:M23 family metallopeptidase [Acetatifactor sp.]